MRVLCTLLLMVAMCWTANAQKNIVSSVDYEHELAYYRPRIALAGDGSHAVAWESFRKLKDTEEWQIGIQKFEPEGTVSQGVIYLQDPASCLSEHAEGGRGVQNADIHFGVDGQLIIAMEPVLNAQEGSYQEKKPRIIVSRIDASGRISSSEDAAPCKTSSVRLPAYRENQRPQLGVIPGSNQYLAVGNLEELGVDRVKDTYPMIASANYSPGSSVYSSGRYAGQNYDAWYDVATNGSLSAYSWQRCPVINDLGDSEECDILIQFVQEGPDAGSVRNKPPVKVNKGDNVGILNYKPAIAMNKQGQSVVVWVDYRYDEKGDILAQRFDTTGWPVGDNIRVSSGAGTIDDLDGIGPEVAMLDDGSFMIVWTEKNYSDMQAMGRVFSGNGAPQDKSFLLHGEQGGETGQADVTSNGSSFAYTWISHEEDGNSIYYHIPGADIVSRYEKVDSKAHLSISGFPNPFSHETTLRYELKSEGPVTLIIYDLLGREIKTLVDKWQAPGTYLVNVSAEELAVGYYVAKLQQGDFQSSKVLIRSR